MEHRPKTYRPIASLFCAGLLVASAAAQEQELTLREVRGALAEIELSVVAHRELDAADERLGELRQQLAQQLAADSDSAELREAGVLVLLAQVELELARGRVEEAWKAFPEPPEGAGPADPERIPIEGLGVIVPDPRVVEMKRYVAARREGAAGSAPEGEALIGLPLARDEVEEAVRDALRTGNSSFILQLGERAAPTLAAVVEEKLDVFPSKKGALCLLAQVHPATAEKVIARNLGKGGFFWKKRVLHAFNWVLPGSVTWDASSGLPATCRLPGLIEALEVLVEDEEVGNEALIPLSWVASKQALTPELQASLARALVAEEPERRAAAVALLPEHRPSKNLVPVLEAVLTAEDADLRARAAQLLCEFPAWNDALAAQVDDPDFRVRASVAQLADRHARNASSGSWELLRRLFGDTSLEVRQRALLGAEGLPVKQVVSTDGRGRTWTSKRFVRPLPLEDLLPLTKDPEIRVRRGVLELAVRSPFDQALALFEALATDSTLEVLGDLEGAIGNFPTHERPLGMLRVLQVFYDNPHYPFERSNRWFQRGIEEIRGHEASAEECARWAAEKGGFALQFLLSHGVGPVAHRVSPETLRSVLLVADRQLDRTAVFGDHFTAGKMSEGHLRMLRALAGEPSASAQLRAYAALAVARQSEGDVPTAALLDALRDPALKGRDWDEVIDSLSDCVRNLPRAKRNTVVAAVVADEGTSGVFANHIAGNVDYSAPGATALADAVLGRWCSKDADQDGERAVRRLLQAMALQPRVRDTAVLRDLIATAHPDWAPHAVETVGKLRDASFLPLLAKVVREQRGTAQWNVAVTKALPGLFTDEAAELLLEAAALADDPETRKHCLASLEEMRKYFLARDYWARRKTLEASREEAVEELVAMLDDSTPAVRAQAAAGLATFDAIEAIPALIRLLKDPDASVAKAASQALVRLNRAREAETGESQGEGE